MNTTIIFMSFRYIYTTFSDGPDLLICFDITSLLFYIAGIIVIGE